MAALFLCSTFAHANNDTIQAAASEYAKSAISKFADKDGFIYPAGTVGRQLQNAASLVRALLPALPPQTQWKKGNDVGPGAPSLRPGTPIATFRASDLRYPPDDVMDPTYDGPAKYANAAIFLGYLLGTGNNEIIGFYVFTQSFDTPARIYTFLLGGVRYPYSVID